MPDSITLIRHAESEYNDMQKVRKTDPLYRQFLKEYKKDPLSNKSKDLALQVKEKFPIHPFDHETSLTDSAIKHTVKLAKKLRKRVPLPDVIYISSYDRTDETLKAMIMGWVELDTVKVIKDKRMRERDQGDAYAYGDWRIYNVLHPHEIKKRNTKGAYHYKFPKGESIHMLTQRVSRWVGSIKKKHTNKNILVISHKKTIISLRMILENFSEDEFMKINYENGPHNNSVTFFKRQGGKLRLVEYNVRLC